VPNIGHRAGEQRPGLAPISPVVIDYFADRPRPDRLDDRAGRNPLPLDAFERIIQINLIGTFRCIAKSAAGMLTLPPLDDGERVVARGAPPALADLTEPSLFGRSSSGSSSTRIGLRSKYRAARCWPETFRQTPRTIQTAARSSSRPPSISSGVASQAKSWCPGCRSKTRPRTVIRR